MLWCETAVAVRSSVARPFSSVEGQKSERADGGEWRRRAERQEMSKKKGEKGEQKAKVLAEKRALRLLVLQGVKQ